MMQKKNGCGWLGLVGVAKDAKRSTRKHPQFAVNAESGESWYSYFDNARTFNPKPATKTPLSPKFCPKPRDTSAVFTSQLYSCKPNVANAMRQ